MLVRFKRDTLLKNPLYNQQRLIFLEKIIDNTETLPGVTSVIILNYSVAYQNNPDNILVEEEVHTFNTYYGHITESKENLTLGSVIWINDFHYNIVYNQLNRISNYFENYSRYSNLDMSPTYRTSVDSKIIELDCPHPKYYTLDEQKLDYGDSRESMKNILINHYKKGITGDLFFVRLGDLKDQYTKMGELKIILNNNIGLLLPKEEKQKLREDIYYLVSSIKYDMELTGVSKIVGLLTPDKGFNITQINTIIRMNPKLTETSVKMFFELFQNRYEEIYLSMVFAMGGLDGLSLYLALEPIQNTVEVSIHQTNQNKLEILQQDIHDQLVNTMF